MVPPRFILASTSPRRRSLLSEAGFLFEVAPPHEEDNIPPANCLPPEELALKLALEKADSVARERPGELVLAADTLVVAEGRILGKPVDKEEAEAMLGLLSGRGHQVITGFCLQRDEEVLAREKVVTEVVFRPLSREEISAYAATGSPLDKAGAYGIQDLGGGLVAEVRGSYTNVVGLPMAEVIEALTRAGVISQGGLGESG